MEQSSGKNRAHILLDNALGPLALSLLRDDVIEVYCNSNDLHVWIEYVGVGRVKTDIVLKAEDRRKIIETVASFSKTIATKNQPLISAELPKYGYRFISIHAPSRERQPCSVVCFMCPGNCSE